MRIKLTYDNTTWLTTAQDCQDGASESTRTSARRLSTRVDAHELSPSLDPVNLAHLPPTNGEVSLGGRHMVTVASAGLGLSEFLIGPSLTHEVALRNQLLTHCVTSKSLPLSELLEVLEHLSRQEDAREAVVDAARRLGPDVAAVRSWLDAAMCNGTVPLCTRLQLHLLAAETVTPPTLQAEATSAFLAGVPLPPEALGLLGASVWVESIRRDAHLAAAALAAQLPAQALLDELASAADDPLTPFLQRGLAHKKRANRRACLDVCALVHGAPRCALLSLLATQQPLHLVADATEPPPASLHDAAALLAVEHGDKRVADTVLLRPL